jgi:hypothetical protein
MGEDAGVAGGPNLRDRALASAAKNSAANAASAVIPQG